ncbi:MAG: glutaredoxin 3 [Gammaproteobacteria bacterium]|jgi:glutaredoxin 3
MSSRDPAAKVEIYTTMTCGYCLCAKRLLEDEHIAFVEYAIDADEQARRLMMQRADGRRSVPQIFINNQGIGGFLELRELVATGRLDDLLSSEIASCGDSNKDGL